MLFMLQKETVEKETDEHSRQAVSAFRDMQTVYVGDLRKLMWDSALLRCITLWIGNMQNKNTQTHKYRT